MGSIVQGFAALKYGYCRDGVQDSNYLRRREIHILDLDQGGRAVPPLHVFANIFMNTYPYFPIF